MTGQPVLTPGRSRRKSARRRQAESTLIAFLLALAFGAFVALGSTTPAWACGLLALVWFVLLVYAASYQRGRV